MASDELRDAIHRALGIIAGQCDGARDDDGVGFNGVDTHAGRQWAAMPAAFWDDDLALAAWDMLRKYRNQLAGAGVDYDELPVPAGGDELVEERRAEARERARERARRWRRSELVKTKSYVNCDGVGDGVVLEFPYVEKLVDEAREIPGRHYVGGNVSVYPFSSLGAVVDFADRHEIAVPDEVRGLVGLVTDQVYVARGGIVIDVPWNEATRALNTDLRQLNNGTSTWDANNRVHRPPFRADPAGLAELIDGYGLSISNEARALLDVRVQASLAGVTATELNDAITATDSAAGPAAGRAGSDSDADLGAETEEPHPGGGAVERVPVKPEERIAANLAAIAVRNQVIAEGRAATDQEREVLASWSSWGAVPKIFADPAEGYNPAEDIYASQRAQLRDLLTDAEYEAAKRTTINAHYTSPALVEAIWGGLAELGFEGGQVLEPGCGSGNFIAAAPEQARMSGVELDPVTADIAALQNPGARIVTGSFAEVRNSGGGFDAAVGNVPFSQVRLFDPRSNSGNHAMHNHAILWSLDNVRAGGLVAVLTSRYTMDAKDHSARAEMARMADLVAAVRLPSGAHRRTAGTDVVTDLLVLRKREKYLDKAKDLKGIPWLHAFNGNKALPLPDGLNINQIFLPPEDQEDEEDQDSGESVEPTGPGRVLGVLTPGTGEAGRAELEVRGSTRDLPQRLADALSGAATAARGDGLTWSPPGRVTKRSGKQQADLPPQLYVPDKDADRFEGMITAHDDGAFTVMEDGAPRPWHCPSSQATELRRLIQLRDQVMQLREAERATTSDTPEIVEQRRVMNVMYDDYAAAYGPLNRCQYVRSGRVDDDGNDIPQRRFPGQGGFRNDPFAWWVYALEDYEETTGEATKSEMFTKRVVEATHRPLSAQTPLDALTVCLDESQQIRLDRVAELLGLGSNAEARQALGELVYDDPRTGQLVPAADYLSGDVRDKLRQAEAAAAGEPVPASRVDEKYAQSVAEILTDVAIGSADEIDISEITAVGEARALDHTVDRGYQPDYSVNVTALQKVMPKELEPGDIAVSLESANAWVPARYVQQFLRETFQDPGLQATRSAGSAWKIQVQLASTDLLEHEWGTKEHPAHKLVRSVLEGRAIRVNPVYPSTDRKTEQQIRAERRRARQQAAVETAEIRAKAEQLNNAFAEWLWLDPKRCQTCVELYNEKFNSLRPRSFDGAELSLPGLSKEFLPDPHQVAAVARFLTQPGTLLGHVVGAGKTASMVMAAMEMRRLGMATKPGFMVPNHLVEQFAREFVRLYPQARIHVIDPKDLTAGRRREEVAKVGAQDWDAVIIPESVFVRIPMSADEQERYVQEKVAEYRRDLERKRANAVESGNKAAEESVKKAQARLLAAEERWRKQIDRARDGGISFEQTGVDYLFVDEAQCLKNLYFHTNNADLAIEGSARAADVDMKLAYFRRAGRAKVVGLATGTPVTNAIAELWTMMRFCIPEQLEAAGIDTFDAFCAQFCAREEVPELAPEGGIQIKERITRYRNVQQLLLLWLSFADIKTAADLKLPTPELAGGGPKNHQIVATVEDQVHRHELADRADEVRSGSVEPDEDNMLAITTDGRKAALDLRLTDMVPSRPGKLITAASEYARVYHENQNLTVSGPDGEQTLPGVFQFVFADLGTPSDQALREGRWILYEEFRLLAAEHGVPYGKTRFIHEARNAVEKENLFAQARRAQIAGLVGSTQKMGTGVNAQKYAKALHHLDQTYRPDWYTQRNGRILRRGNIFFDLGIPIEIHNYLLEGSFDAYMAQLNERKKTFIDQVITGRITLNEIEEIDVDTVFSPTQIKAIASGDDRMLRKAQLDAQVNKLGRLESAHRRNQIGLKNNVAIFESNLTDLRRQLDRLEAARGRVVSTRGDAFAMTIHDPDSGEMLYDKRSEAAEALHRMWITKATQMQQDHLSTLSLGPVAELGGFTLRATLKYEQKRSLTGRLDMKEWFEYTATFNIDGIPNSQFDVTVTEFDPDSPKPATSAITQAENKINGLDKQHANLTSQIETLEQQLAAANARVDQPFPQADELTEAKREADRLGEEIRNDTEEEHDRGIDDLLAQMTGPFTETYSGNAALQTAVATARQHADVDGIAYLSVHRDTDTRTGTGDQNRGSGSDGGNRDRVTVSMMRPDGPYAVTVGDGSWRLFDGDPNDATLLDGPPDEQIQQRLMLASEHAASRSTAPLYGRVIITVRGPRGIAVEVNQPIIAVWDASAGASADSTSNDATNDEAAHTAGDDAGTDDDRGNVDDGGQAAPDPDVAPMQWVTVADGTVWVVSPGTSPTIYNPDSPALSEALRTEVDAWIAQAAENFVGVLTQQLDADTEHDAGPDGEPDAGSAQTTLPGEPVREVLTTLATAATADTALLRARPVAFATEASPDGPAGVTAEAGAEADTEGGAEDRTGNAAAETARAWLVTFVRAGGEQVDCTFAPDGVLTDVRINYDGEPEAVPLPDTPPDGAEATVAWLLTAAPQGRATGKARKAQATGRGRTQRSRGRSSPGPEQEDPRQTSIPSPPDSTGSVPAADNSAGDRTQDREPPGETADEPTDHPAQPATHRGAAEPAEQPEAPAEADTPSAETAPAGRDTPDTATAPPPGSAPFGSEEEAQRHYDALRAAWHAWGDTATGDDLLNWDTTDPVYGGRLWAAELAQNTAQAWERLTGFTQRTSPAARQSIIVAYASFREAAGHLAGNLRPARSDAGPPDPSADLIDRVVALADEHIERLSATPLPQPDPHIADTTAERAQAALATGGSYRRAEHDPVDRDVFERTLYSHAVAFSQAAASPDGRGRIDPTRRLIYAELHGVDLYIGLGWQDEEPVIALGFDELDLPQIRYTVGEVEAISATDLLSTLEDQLFTGLNITPENITDAAADSSQAPAEPAAGTDAETAPGSAAEPTADPTVERMARAQEAAARGVGEDAGGTGEIYLLTHADGVAQYVAGPELYRYLHDLAYAVPDLAAVDVSEEGRILVLAPVTDETSEEVEFSAELWHDGITRINPVDEADLEPLPGLPEPAAGTEPSWAQMQRDAVSWALTDDELEAELDGDLMADGWIQLQPLDRWYAHAQARGAELPRDGAGAGFDDVWAAWGTHALPILDVMTLARLRHQAERRAALNNVRATPQPEHGAEQVRAEANAGTESQPAPAAMVTPRAEPAPEPGSASEEEPAAPSAMTEPTEPSDSRPSALALGDGEPGAVTPDTERWAVRLGPYTTAEDLVAGHRAVFHAHQRLRHQLRHVRVPSEARAQAQVLASTVGHLVEALQTPKNLPAAVADVRLQAAHLADMTSAVLGRTGDVAERQLADAAEMHVARLYACTPQERAALAARAVRLFNAGTPTPDTADPVGLNPQPYTNAEEFSDDFERLRAAARVWRPGASDRGRGEIGLVDALATHLGITPPPGAPDLAWVGEALSQISDAAYARLAGASEPVWGRLAMIVHESWQVASRLQAPQVQAEKLYGYQSVVDATAAGEQLVTAIAAWRETNTSRGLSPGRDIDVEATLGMLGLGEAEVANTPESPHAWRDRMLALAHDAYGLLMSLPSDQFATPDDAQVLRKLVTGAYRQASRIGDTSNIDVRAAYAAPIQTAFAAPVPDPKNLQPGHLLITHGATGTHLHGSGQQDRALHDLLKQRGHDFEFYGRGGYWFVKPRSRAFNDRGRRVRQLCQALERPLDGTSWTVHVVFTDQRPDTIEIPERPAFTTRSQAGHALDIVLSAYETMTAETTWDKLRYQDRLDVDRVEQGYRRLPRARPGRSLRDSLLDADPDVLAARIGDWAKAALALDASLTEQNYRAKKLRPFITQMATAAEDLAGRLQTTLTDPAARTVVFPTEPTAAASTSHREAPDEANDFDDNATDRAEHGAAGEDAEPQEPTGPPSKLPDRPSEEEFTNFAQRLGLRPETWRSATDERRTINVRITQGYTSDTLVRREPDGDLYVPGLGPVTGTQAGRLTTLYLANQDVALEELFARATTVTPPPVPERDAATGDAITQMIPTVSAGGSRTIETTEPDGEPDGSHEERGPVPSLTKLRELAEAHDLRLRGTYAGGRLYLQLCEHGAGRASPVVDIDLDATQARSGPYPIALDRIGDFLATYRAYVPAEWFALEPENPRRTYIEYGWRRRLADLAPYLPPGEHHRDDVADHVGHAVQAAREGRATDADTLLTRAEKALGTQWVMAASRQAVCLPVMDEYAVAYAWTGDVGRYVAERLADVADFGGQARPGDYVGDVGDKVSPLEEAWIGHQLRTFDLVARNQPVPTMEARAARDRAERARVQARMKQLSDAARDAKRAGEYDRALQLLDIGEVVAFAFTDGADLHMPGQIIWGKARADVLADRASSGSSTAAAEAPVPGAETPPPAAQPEVSDLDAVDHGAGEVLDAAERHLAAQLEIDPPGSGPTGLDEPSAVSAEARDSSGPQQPQEEPAAQTGATGAGDGPDTAAQADQNMPYRDMPELSGDLGPARRADATVRATSAWKRRTAGSNAPPKMAALDEASSTALRSLSPATWHTGYDVAKIEAWAQAAEDLDRDLSEGTYRAPKLQEAVAELASAARRFADRLQATKNDPEAWRRVFSGATAQAAEQAETPDRDKSDHAEPPELGDLFDDVTGANAPAPGDAPDTGSSEEPGAEHGREADWQQRPPSELVELAAHVGTTGLRYAWDLLARAEQAVLADQGQPDEETLQRIADVRVELRRNSPWLQWELRTRDGVEHHQCSYRDGHLRNVHLDVRPAEPGGYAWSVTGADETPTPSGTAPTRRAAKAAAVEASGAATEMPGFTALPRPRTYARTVKDAHQRARDRAVTTEEPAFIDLTPPERSTNPAVTQTPPEGIHLSVDPDEQWAVHAGPYTIATGAMAPNRDFLAQSEKWLDARDLREERHPADADIGTVALAHADQYGRIAYVYAEDGQVVVRSGALPPDGTPGYSVTPSVEEIWNHIDTDGVVRWREEPDPPVYTDLVAPEPSRTPGTGQPSQAQSTAMEPATTRGDDPDEVVAARSSGEPEPFPYQGWFADHFMAGHIGPVRPAGEKATTGPDTSGPEAEKDTDPARTAEDETQTPAGPDVTAASNTAPEPEVMDPYEAQDTYDSSRSGFVTPKDQMGQPVLGLGLTPDDIREGAIPTRAQRMAAQELSRKAAEKLGEGEYDTALRLFNEAERNDPYHDWEAQHGQARAEAERERAAARPDAASVAHDAPAGDEQPIGPDTPGVKPAPATQPTAAEATGGAGATAHDTQAGPGPVTIGEAAGAVEQPGLFEVDPGSPLEAGKPTSQGPRSGGKAGRGATPSPRAAAVSQPADPDQTVPEPDAAAGQDATSEENEEEIDNAGSEESRELAGSAGQATDALAEEAPSGRRADSTPTEPIANPAPAPGAEQDGPRPEPRLEHPGRAIPGDVQAQPEPEPTESAHSTPNLRSEARGETADTPDPGGDPVTGEPGGDGSADRPDTGRDQEAPTVPDAPDTSVSDTGDGTAVLSMPSSETSEKPTTPATETPTVDGVLAALDYPPTVEGLGIRNVRREEPRDGLPERFTFQMRAPEGIRRRGWVSAEPDHNQLHTVHLTDQGLPDGSITELDALADVRSLTNVIAAQMREAHRLLAAASAIQIDGDPAEADTLAVAIEHAEHRATATANPQYLWLAKRAAGPSATTEPGRSPTNAWTIGPLHPAHPGWPGERIRVEPGERAEPTWFVQLDQHTGHHGVDGRIDRRLIGENLFAPDGGIDYIQAHRLVDQTAAEDICAMLSLPAVGLEATARYSSSDDSWSVTLPDPADPKSTLQVAMPAPGALYPVMRNGVWASALKGVTANSTIVDVVDAVLELVGLGETPTPAKVEAEQAPPPVADVDTPPATGEDTGSRGAAQATAGPPDTASGTTGRGSEADFIQTWNRQAVQREANEGHTAQTADDEHDIHVPTGPADSADPAGSDEDPAQRLAEQARRAPDLKALRRVWYDTYSAGLLAANVTVQGEEHQLDAYLDTRSTQLGATPRTRPVRQGPGTGAAPATSSRSRTASGTGGSATEPTDEPTAPVPPQEAGAPSVETREVPATLDAAAEADGLTPRERLVEAHAHAVAFYRNHLFTPEAEPVRQYLSDPVDAEPNGRNIGHVLEPDSVWQIGYAPPPSRGNWSPLRDHLLELGFSDVELIDAGLAKISSRGTIIDRFRDQIMAPIRDIVSGECVAFMARKNPTNTFARNKYTNSPETAIFKKNQHLFGGYEGRTELENGCMPIVCEGYFDVIAVAAARQPGDPVPVAALGARFGPAQAGLLGKSVRPFGPPFGPAVIGSDGDRAGRLAAAQWGEELEKKGFGLLYVPDMPVKDFGDLAGDHERIRAVITDHSRGMDQAREEARHLALLNEIDQMILQARRKADPRAVRREEEPRLITGAEVGELVYAVAEFTSRHPHDVQTYGLTALLQRIPPPEDGGPRKDDIDIRRTYEQRLLEMNAPEVDSQSGPAQTAPSKHAAAGPTATSDHATDEASTEPTVDDSSTFTPPGPGAVDTSGTAHGEADAAQTASATDDWTAADADDPSPPSPSAARSAGEQEEQDAVRLPRTGSRPALGNSPPPAHATPGPATRPEPDGDSSAPDDGPAATSTTRRRPPIARIPAPRPFAVTPEGWALDEAALNRAALLVAARLHRAAGRGDHTPSGPASIVPVLVNQWSSDQEYRGTIPPGMLTACAELVADRAWYSDWGAAGQAVAQGLDNQLSHAQSPPADIRADAVRAPGEVHHDPPGPPAQDPPAGPQINTAAQAADAPAAYGSRVEAEAQSLRVNGLLWAAALAVESAGLDSPARHAAEAVQQLRDAWLPMDQRGIAAGPAAAAGRYRQILDACRHLDRQIVADLASGLLTQDETANAWRARRDVWVLDAGAQTHIGRLDATPDHPRAAAFTGRGPAEHASQTVATACEAWASTPFGRAAMGGELPDRHTGTVANIQAAWQDIYDHGLNDGASVAAQRFRRLSEALHVLEENVLSDGTADAWSDGTAAGELTVPLHTAADRALAVSTRLEATGMRHAWHGNRRQARRWERHHRPVAGLPSRLNDHVGDLLSRVKASGAAGNSGGTGPGVDATRTPAGVVAGAATGRRRGAAARIPIWSDRQEGHTGR